MNSATLPPLDQFFTNTGESLQALSDRVPVLLVFLRHSGCPFCRQTLADLANRRKEIEQSGLVTVLVHMMTDEDAAALFDRYQLADFPRIGDAEGNLYRALGRIPGTVNQVIGPKVWWYGFKAALLDGHWMGKPQGDVFRMPGAFVIHRGKVVESFEPGNSYERIDLEKLTSCSACRE